MPTTKRPIKDQHGEIQEGPSTFYKAVVPGAAALVDGPCRAILATAGGTVNVTRADGTDVDAVPIATGVPLPIVATKIRAGGTATGLFALY